MFLHRKLLLRKFGQFICFFAVRAKSKEALREAAKLLGVAKREIYRLVHQNKNGAK